MSQPNCSLTRALRRFAAPHLARNAPPHAFGAIAGAISPCRRAESMGAMGMPERRVTPTTDPGVSDAGAGHYGRYGSICAVRDRASVDRLNAKIIGAHTGARISL